MKSLVAIGAVFAGLLAVTPAAAQFSMRTGSLGGSISSRAIARPLGGPVAANRYTRGPSRAPLYRGYPYAYSVWVPDYFDSPDYQNQQYLPAPDASQAGGPPPPPVIINQYFGAPGPPQANPPEANNTTTAAPGDPIGTPPNYYLIAYKNHAIYPAIAYWVEDKTLHYVTTQNTHNQASLDLIDLAMTKSLNQRNEVPFAIPGQ